MDELNITYLTFLGHPLIRTERDLERIFACIDYIHYFWPDSQYSETRTRGLCWMLRSLSESGRIRPDLKFCDIGLGRGTVIATFAALGYRTYAVDLDSQPLKHATSFFPDRTTIDEMDLYYAFIRDNIDSTPKLMKVISPQTGSTVIHFCPWFDTPERLKLKGTPKRYPTYSELGFRLINQNRMMMDEFERNRMGIMEEGYRPIWVKE
jgi:hypothetical protein